MKTKENNILTAGQVDTLNSIAYALANLGQQLRTRAIVGRAPGTLADIAKDLGEVDRWLSSELDRAARTSADLRPPVIPAAVS